MAAHFLGCLKTAFLDASLGLLLLTSVVNFEGAEKQNIIVAESVWWPKKRVKGHVKRDEKRHSKNVCSST